LQRNVNEGKFTQVSTIWGQNTPIAEFLHKPLYSLQAVIPRLPKLRRKLEDILETLFQTNRSIFTASEDGGQPVSETCSPPCFSSSIMSTRFGGTEYLIFCGVDKTYTSMSVSNNSSKRRATCHPNDHNGSISTSWRKTRPAIVGELIGYHYALS
jgi:hypothetical protein